jgi:3-hydroxy-9,10-secoandrosta-1,3,5(10)-triene-9,17-dione monooxygenase
VSTTRDATGSPQPPAPGSGPEDLVARARALQPQLIAEQAATEARTYYSPELHQAFLDAGFYHLYVPKRYGGYEFDAPTYMRVVGAIARGCVSSGWCLGLCMNHALHVASWWPQSAQDAIFAANDFRCASVAAPVGNATRTDDGWQINGQVAFASGSPYSTYYMGQAFGPPETPDGPPTMIGFVAPRDQWEMLDDWGDMLGLKGSGSQSLRFENTRIPADWGQPLNMIDVDVAGGTVGSELHGNPMYSGRGMTIFTLSLACVMVGGAYNALDEFENIMRAKTTAFPPFPKRIDDADFQRWYGRALARVATAEAAMMDCARQHMEACRRNVEDGIPFTYEHDMLLAGIAREVIIQCWDIVNDDLWQKVGASVLRDGQRLPRVFRDLSIGIAHRNAMMREFFYGEIGRGGLGLTRAEGMFG